MNQSDERDREIRETVWACYRKSARLIIRVSAILASANKEQRDICV